MKIEGEASHGGIWGLGLLHKVLDPTLQNSLNPNPLKCLEGQLKIQNLRCLHNSQKPLYHMLVYSLGFRDQVALRALSCWLVGLSAVHRKAARDDRELS